MSEFPVYQPAGEPEGSGRAGSVRTWMVLVEFSNHGEAKPPTVIEQVGGNHHDLETAIEAARRAAFEFEPPDPYAPQGRRVFQTGDRDFLTMIDGMMSTFHFSTRVAEHLADV